MDNEMIVGSKVKAKISVFLLVSLFSASVMTCNNKTDKQKITFRLVFDTLTAEKLKKSELILQFRLRKLSDRLDSAESLSVDVNRLNKRYNEQIQSGELSEILFLNPVTEVRTFNFSTSNEVHVPEPTSYSYEITYQIDLNGTEFKGLKELLEDLGKNFKDFQICATCINLVTGKKIEELRYFNLRLTAGGEGLYEISILISIPKLGDQNYIMTDYFLYSNKIEGIWELYDVPIVEAYKDRDGDGWGGYENVSVIFPYFVSGVTVNGGDLNDSDVLITPLTLVWEDNDHDGWGGSVSKTISDFVNEITEKAITNYEDLLFYLWKRSYAMLGNLEGLGDCDDNEKNVHPGAFLICGDEKDNDCDGKVEIWVYADKDGNGFAEGLSACVNELADGQIKAGEELGRE